MRHMRMFNEADEAGRPPKGVRYLPPNVTGKMLSGKTKGGTDPSGGSMTRVDWDPGPGDVDLEWFADLIHGDDRSEAFSQYVEGVVRKVSHQHKVSMVTDDHPEPLPGGGLRKRFRIFYEKDKIRRNSMGLRPVGLTEMSVDIRRLKSGGSHISLTRFAGDAPAAGPLRVVRGPSEAETVMARYECKGAGQARHAVQEILQAVAETFRDLLAEYKKKDESSLIGDVKQVIAGLPDSHPADPGFRVRRRRARNAEGGFTDREAARINDMAARLGLKPVRSENGIMTFTRQFEFNHWLELYVAGLDDDYIGMWMALYKDDTADFNYEEVSFPDSAWAEDQIGWDDDDEEEDQPYAARGTQLPETMYFCEELGGLKLAMSEVVAPVAQACRRAMHFDFDGPMADPAYLP